MNRPLLGFEALRPGPPCAISVPNLKTDRPVVLRSRLGSVDVRRLMYQSLIWLSGRLRTGIGSGCKPLRAIETVDQACRFAAAGYAQPADRAAHALIDGMRGDAKLGRDLLRVEMPVDEAQNLELSAAQQSAAVVTG